MKNKYIRYFVLSLLALGFGTLWAFVFEEDVLTEIALAMSGYALWEGVSANCDAKSRE